MHLYMHLVFLFNQSTNNCKEKTYAPQHLYYLSVIALSLDRPTIVLPAFTYNANFGQDVTLQCNVTSVSTLTQVTWRKYINGSPNVLVVSGSAHYSGGNTFTPSLTIHTLSFSDSGNYDCSATNIAGTSTSSQMTLNVIGSTWAACVDTLYCSYAYFIELNVVYNLYGAHIYITLKSRLTW